MSNLNDVEKQALDEEDDDESEDDDYVPSGEEGSFDDEPQHPYIQRHFAPLTHFSGDDEDLDAAASDASESGDEDGGKRKRRRKVFADPEEDVKPEKKLTPEEEKAKSDALWAELNSSSSAPSTSVLKAVPLPPAATAASSSLSKVVPKAEIVEPSGEIRIAPSSGLTGLAALRNSASGAALKRPSGGLSQLLTTIGKKNQPSTLLKSKADWESYKAKEGLSEELHEHTKSKDSFVERQAFLQRTDLRQFEQEKSIRDRNRARQPK